MYRTLSLELFPNEEERQELDKLISYYQSAYNSLSHKMYGYYQENKKLPTMADCNNFLIKNYGDMKSAHRNTIVYKLMEWFKTGGYMYKNGAKIIDAHTLQRPMVWLAETKSYALNYKKSEPKLDKKLSIRVTNTYSNRTKPLHLKFKVLDRNTQQVAQMWRLYVYNYLFEKGVLDSTELDLKGNIVYDRELLASFEEVNKLPRYSKDRYLNDPVQIPYVMTKIIMAEGDYRQEEQIINEWKTAYETFSKELNDYEKSAYSKSRLTLDIPQLKVGTLIREDGRYFLYITVEWNARHSTIKKPKTGSNRLSVFFEKENGINIWLNGKAVDIDETYAEDIVFRGKNLIAEIDRNRKWKRKHKRRRNWKHYHAAKRRNKKLLKATGSAYGKLIRKLLGSSGGIVYVGYAENDRYNWDFMRVIESMNNMLLEQDIDLFNKEIIARPIEIKSENDGRFESLEDFNRFIDEIS